MTREEEIIKASHRYAKPLQKPFIDGARWADKTMIDKACEWLEKNADIYNNGTIIALNCLIEDFKKAMEE